MRLFKNRSTWRLKTHLPYRCPCVAQVLTGRQPWAGVDINDVSARVSRGERPPLAFEGTSLEGHDGFGDLVRLLWAQEPIARPALKDVARSLRGTEPTPADSPRVAEGSTNPAELTKSAPLAKGGAQSLRVTEPARADSPRVAEGPTTSVELTKSANLAEGGAQSLRGTEPTRSDSPRVAEGSTISAELTKSVPDAEGGDQELGIGEIDGNSMLHADDINRDLLVAAEARVEKEGGGADAEAKPETAADGRDMQKEEGVSKAVTDDKLVCTALAPSSPLPETKNTSSYSAAVNTPKNPASDTNCGDKIAPSVGKDGGGSDQLVLGVSPSPIPGGGSRERARPEELESPGDADGSGGELTLPEDESCAGKGSRIVEGLSPKMVAAALTTALSSAVANDADGDTGGSGGGTAVTPQAEAATAEVATAEAATAEAAGAAAAGAGATTAEARSFSLVDREKKKPRSRKKKRAKSLAEVVTKTWRDIMSEDGWADRDCDDGEGAGSDIFYGAVSDVSPKKGVADYGDDMNRQPWVTPRGGAGPIDHEAVKRDAFAVGAGSDAKSSFPAMQSSPLTAKFSRPLLSSSPLGSGDTPPYLHHKGVSDVGDDEPWAKRRARGVGAGMLIPPLAHVLSTEGSSKSDFESDDGDEGYFSSSEKHTHTMFTSPIISTAAGAKTISKDGRSEPLPTWIPSPSIRPGSGYTTGTPKAEAESNWGASSTSQSGSIGSGLSPASAVNARMVAATTRIRQSVSSDQPHGTSQRRTDGTASRAVDTSKAGAVPARVPSPAARPGEIGSGLAPAAAVTAGVVAASAPLRRSASLEQPHSTSRRQARKVAAGGGGLTVETRKARYVPASVPSPITHFGRIGSGLTPAAYATADFVAASAPLHRGDRPRSTPQRRAGIVAAGTGRVVDRPEVGDVPARVPSPAAMKGGIGSGLAPAAAVTASVVAASPRLRQTARSDEPYSSSRRQAHKAAAKYGFAAEPQVTGVMPALVRHPPVRFGKVGISLPPAEAGIAASAAASAGARASSNPIRRAASSDQPYSARRGRTVKDATGTEHVLEAPKAEAVSARARSPGARPGKISSGLRPASTISAAVVAPSAPLRRAASADQPHDEDVPRQQPDKDVVGSLHGLLSPDLSQLSTTSRGGATVEVTPPPASSGGRGKRTPVQGSAPVDASPLEANTDVGRGGVPETPSRRRRAGAALRGFAMSFSRFGKGKKRDAGIGVESFPLEER